MPQMAPMMWLSLFMMFVMTLMLFSMMNYYSIIPQPINTSMELKKIKTSMNWKW